MGLLIIVPFLHLGEWLGLHARPRSPLYPRIDAQIRDGEFAAYKPEAMTCGLLRREPVVEDLVQPPCLCLVAVDGVLDLFGRVAIEVVCYSIPQPHVSPTG